MAAHLVVFAELAAGRVVVLAQAAPLRHRLERHGERRVDRLPLLGPERGARELHERRAAARELPRLPPGLGHAEARFERLPAVHGVAVRALDREARPHLVQDRRALLDRHGVALGVQPGDAAVAGQQQQPVARLAVGRAELPGAARNALALLGPGRGHRVAREVALGVLLDADAGGPREQRHGHGRPVLRARGRRQEVAVPDAGLLRLVGAPAGGVPDREPVIAVEVGHERLLDTAAAAAGTPARAPARAPAPAPRTGGRERGAPATRSDSSGLPS